MPSELTREATIPSGSRREATVPPDLESQLIKEMNSVMTGSLKHVDRGLLETACRDITDMADELQANKEASRSISGPSNNHGPGETKIDVAEKMKILKDMLQKIDWQLYKTLPSGYYQGPGQSASSNKSGVSGHEPELPHWILKRTGRIFVDLNKLVDLLTSISRENSSEPVILPIVGLGGIGKTTLAKLLYSHTKFKDYSKTWVKNPNDGLFREQLPLGDNKILVVLDDLQDKAGRRILDMKRNLIRDVGKNAIVIVTTCSEGAAKKIHTVQPYKLQADM
ncbi:hypothetical protein HU200_026934 [Digitaria exilis]|uniref:NB-ARC domain-containing protein n=1 Tax=Digitaria exilis TaxID=1010633 RepID=A0A835ERL7_9POAL|nr:hypothetical protein HU200_026934 [Digitaria exilis]